MPSQFMFSQSTDNVTMINGQSIKGASPTTRADLMKRFFTTADRHARGYEDAAAPAANPQPLPRPRASDPADYSLYNPATATPVAIPSTPSSLLPPPKSIHQEKDDGGPFKLEMIARMEELQRGERVIPPCDRCRRLHMDCLKNLTACVGCTKKHAKCSWRDVKEDEVAALRAGVTTSTVSNERPDNDRSTSNVTPPRFMGPLPPISAEREHPREPPFEPEVNAYYQHRRESAPSAPNPAPGSAVPMELPSGDNSPRRAVSETEKRDRPHAPAGRVSDRSEDEDPDANQRLRQAIMDTVDHHTRVAAAVQKRELGAERGEHPGKSAAGVLPAAGPAPASNAGSYDRERDQEREREADRDRDRDRDRRMVHA